MALGVVGPVLQRGQRPYLFAFAGDAVFQVTDLPLQFRIGRRLCRNNTAANIGVTVLRRAGGGGLGRRFSADAVDTATLVVAAVLIRSSPRFCSTGQSGARCFPNDRVRSCRPGPETQRRKFVGTSCPGFVDDRRENAGPAAFWPSTRRGRVRTVASTCKDRHFDGGGGLREPPHPRTGLVPTTRGIRSRLAQASTGARVQRPAVASFEDLLARVWR